VQLANSAAMALPLLTVVDASSCATLAERLMNNTV
jgi:hypothetical protein